MVEEREGGEDAQEKQDDEEETFDEIIDLEEFAKRGERPPKAKGYRFKVNDHAFVTTRPVLTGSEILEIAGLTPVAKYRLRLKVAGGKPEPIGPADKVDLRRPGIEKFRAIRKDQNEGEYQGRREAPALDQDRVFLDTYGLPWEIVVDGSIWVLIHNFSLPKGYSSERVTLAIRLEGGYPLAALDMMYVHPHLTRLDGKLIGQANVVQHINGIPFQRWSRHRAPDNPWVPGQDSLETHIYLVEECFEAEMRQ